MHLQEARRSDDAATDPAPAWPAPAGLPPATPSPGGREAALAIPFARGFDAAGMGATLVVHLPPDDAGTEPRPAPEAGVSAARAEPEVPWLVGGLKLLALALGLGAAYLAGLLLFGAPTTAGPADRPALTGPAR